MRGINYIFAVLFITFAVSLAKVRWSDWRALTRCSARPCGCEANKKDSCKEGLQVQVRICLRDQGDYETCKFDGDLSIRQMTCRNGNDTCPGWSSWTYPEECDCTNKNAGVKFLERFCNNPPPIHEDVKCVIDEFTTGLHEEDPQSSTNCTCEDEVTTEMPFTEAISTAQELPCCIKNSIQYPAYGNYGNNNTASPDAYNDFGNGGESHNASNDSSSASNGPDYLSYDSYEYEGITCRYGNGCPEKSDSTESGDSSSLEL